MAVLMGAAIYAAGLLPFPNLWSMLLVQIPTGVVIYVSLCRMFRLAGFMEMWQLGWNRLALLRSGAAG
jgi:hypothetical protein